MFHVEKDAFPEMWMQIHKRNEEEVDSFLNFSQKIELKVKYKNMSELLRLDRPGISEDLLGQ